MLIFIDLHDIKSENNGFNPRTNFVLHSVICISYISYDFLDFLRFLHFLRLVCISYVSYISYFFQKCPTFPTFWKPQRKKLVSRDLHAADDSKIVKLQCTSLRGLRPCQAEPYLTLSHSIWPKATVIFSPAAQIGQILPQKVINIVMISYFSDPFH